jgi:hypothetical protein
MIQIWPDRIVSWDAVNRKVGSSCYLILIYEVAEKEGGRSGEKTDT